MLQSLKLLSIAAAAFAAAVSFAPAQTAPPAQAPILTSTARFLPVIAKHGMVASQEKRATRVGVEILKAGGNAVDAAVAVGFALAVTHPQAGNIGGGGFMLVHLAARNETIAIDYRETAPAAMTRDVFLDANGEADPKKSRDSALGVGVPGTVAGLALAHEKYGSGKFTLAQLIAPAIQLAREGFEVDDELADTLPRAQLRLARWPASAKIFLKSDGAALARGDRLVQTDLADVARNDRRTRPARLLRRFARREDRRRRARQRRHHDAGRSEGLSRDRARTGARHLSRLWHRIDAAALLRRRAPDPDAQHPGGISAAPVRRRLGCHVSPDDRSDEARLCGPRRISRRSGFRERPGRGSHVEALRQRTAQARSIWSAHGPRRASAPAIRPPREGDNTTHYSVVDKDGNAVANTYTLNFFYGLGLVAEGTGILLNNELDDFAAKPGAPNAFGLVGGDANAPGPGKRPLSSMSPTIVFYDGRVLLVTGTHGGSRIITMVLQIILNVIDHQMNIAEAVAAPRIHHQWLPDQVDAESGLSPDTIRLLEARGHKIVVGRTFGSANSIMVTPEGLAGAADPRQRGTLAEGY